MSLLERMQGFIDHAEQRLEEKRKFAEAKSELERDAKKVPLTDYACCCAVLESMRSNGVISNEKAEKTLSFYTKAVNAGAGNVKFRDYLAEALADVKDLYICEKGEFIVRFFQEAIGVRVYDGIFHYIPDVTKNLPKAKKYVKQIYDDAKKQREDFEKENAADYELYQQWEKRFAYYPQNLRTYYRHEDEAEMSCELVAEFANKIKSK